MSEATKELLRACEALPPEKVAEVTDFARFLASRLEDETWERTLSERKPRPRLEAFLQESSREGEEPLDLQRL